TSGHCGTWLLDSQNAWGEESSTLAGAILSGQGTSLNQESSVIAQA
ncbi:transposase, partial [Aphanothece hegewaldii CCALA 016]